MKPLNLKEALAGKPVRLRDGHKAIIYYCVPDDFKIDEEGTLDSFPVKGMILDKDGYIIKSTVSWCKNGKFRSSEANEDIVGMWEEPFKLEDLPKPFKPKENEKYWVINPDYFKPLQYQAISLNHSSILNSNCFRTEADAQKWIDFMKSQIEE